LTLFPNGGAGEGGKRKTLLSFSKEREKGKSIYISSRAGGERGKKEEHRGLVLSKSPAEKGRGRIDFLSPFFIGGAEGKRIGGSNPSRAEFFGHGKGKRCRPRRFAEGKKEGPVLMKTTIMEGGSPDRLAAGRKEEDLDVQRPIEKEGKVEH